MTPIHWLLIVCPAAVLGAVLFIGVFERVDNTAEEQRATVQLKQMEFDKQFADAWNEGVIKGPSDAELEEQRALVKELKDLARKARESQRQDLERLAQQLQGQLENGDISEDLANLRKEIQAVEKQQNE
ncbi:hypothetical protein CKA27_25815 [Vibrio coralliilyticus]|uniref:hypothetical protein n=1 Tax=Pseudomonadati TaxID=3379134 RepID=UPI0005763788|nr:MULTISPECIES: hypothetical protein [Vibrio]MDF4311326.1 hypothetical protein [Vibrio parahaemolyticus]MDF4345855.1 hypothetical protein [Vibrio parahaemolyticus]MDF4350568.1 hypothetical protein [Vibrio parahaemolyticus]MDG2580530.1 hypothetical protein [Vibrio parahaemolyticus]MDG2594874.1 hypothetical protein [Vibrio parahaemolyticus]